MATTHPTHRDSTHSSIIDLNDVHTRVTSAIGRALLEKSLVLLEALPATGKSHGLIKAVSETGVPVTIFTLRGRKEQYKQYRQLCSDYGLSGKVLPSVHESCPTAQGDHGDEPQQRMKRFLDAGASAGHTHDRLDLPCTKNGQCPYEQQVDFDPSNYDVLIGHPSHAHVDTYLENRVPVFDEFPGEAYLEKINDTPDVVTRFLQSHGVEFQNYTDLLENRDNDDRRRRELDRLQHLDLVDEQRLFSTPGDPTHKLASLCILTLLESENLGNGWEHAILGRDRVGLFNKRESTIYILNPPNLSDHVIGLDGTPTKSMWDLALGLYDRRRRLDHQRVFNDDERWEYLLNVQNLQVIPTTTAVRPYSGGNTYPSRDAALIAEVARKHTGTKGMISTRKGLQDLGKEYTEFGQWSTAYFGNLLGSNRLGDVDVGIILGSPHYGDAYIKKWGALAGIAVESNKEHGLDKSYGEFGDKVLQHMREHSVLQALFRFARQGDGAIVYVDTVALPDWVPVVANPNGTDINTRSSSELDIIASLEGLGEGRTRTVANEADVSKQYVRRILNDLADKGLVSNHPAPDGRGGAKVWVDNHLNRLNSYGNVTLTKQRDPARFSKHPPYRTPKGSVSKKSSGGLKRQREREARAKFERRRSRQQKQLNMQKWFASR